MIRLCSLPTLYSVALLALLCGHAAAQPIDRGDIPPELRDWVGWVLDGTDPPCTTVGDDQDTRCLWPAALVLDLKTGGAAFRFDVISESEDWVPLPGSADHWPLDVKVGAKAVVIEEGPGDSGDLPWVRLEAGVHTITGRFAWNEAPSRLQIPDDLAAVKLRRGTRALPAQRPEPGQLLLPAPDAGQEPDVSEEPDVDVREDAEATRLAGAPDALELRVHRLVHDGNPVRITTQVDLVVSGREREVALGGLHLDGTLPYAIDTGLSYRVDEAQNVFVQVAAGHHSLRAHARVHGQGETLSAPSRQPPWPPKEVWAFAPAPRVREVKLSGAPGIDASRTELPAEWRGHSSYQLGKGGSLKIETLRRGVTEDSASELHLTRAAFIGEDGARWYLRDWLRGQLSSSGRVDLTAGELGRLTREGSDLVITQGPASGRPGVGVPSGSVAFEAEWRMDRGGSLPAAGWSRPVRDTSLTVHVPRDQHLLHAYGADTLGGLWWEAWDTERILLLLLIVAGFALIGDRRTAAAALLGLLGLGSMAGDAGLWFVAVLLAATWMLLRVEHPALRRLSLVAWPMCALATLLMCLETAHDELSNPGLTSPQQEYPMAAESVEEEAPMERSRGEEGGMGKRHRDDSDPLMARMEAKEARAPRRAKSKTALSSDSKDALGALLAEDVGANFGFGGLGLAGKGRGGGGTGDGSIGLGNIGTLGHGGGGLGGAPGAANVPRAVVRGGKPDVRGSLSAGVVRRVARAHNNEVRSCYAQELSQQPALAGNVAVKFIVSPTGAVQMSAVASSSLGNARVEQCIAQAVRRWSFPKPEGGGIVVVTHPFVLSARGAERRVPVAAPPPATPAAHAVDETDEADGSDEADEADASDVPAVAQTGFGMPVYPGQTFVASWDGEVAGDQRLGLWMVSTSQLRALALLWIALLAVALWSLLRIGAARMHAVLESSADRDVPPPSSPSSPSSSAGSGAAAAAVLLAVGALLSSSPAHAAPSEQLLEELATRLQRQPDCASDCLSVSHLGAQLRGDTLTLTADVHAARRVALTIPGPADVWLPAAVRIDGKPARALALVGDHLTVRVPPGRHVVTMVGPVTGDELTLQLGEVPHEGGVTAPGWDVGGVSGDSIAAQWSFSRQEPSAETPDPATSDPVEPTEEGPAAVVRPVLPSWWRIQRDFRMDVHFRMRTQVQRVGPVDRATTLELPLLPDETITTVGIEQEDGHAVLTLGPGQRSVTVNSRLKRRDHLALQAEPDAPWTEIWTVTCSELWQCEGKGVPALSKGSSAVYAPWPGEKLDLALQRPAPAEAPTLTIDDATLRVTQDPRNQRATLRLTLRTALQSTVAVELPKGAVVRKLEVRGEEREVDASQSTLEISVPSGATAIAVEFEVATVVGLATHSPEVKVAGTVVNAHTVLDIQQQERNLRVLLADTSEGVDPFSSRWLQLLPWLLLSLMLVRLRGMPLGIRHFMLIGLVDVFASAPLGLALVIPLVLLTQRGALPLPTQGLRRLATVMVLLSAGLGATIWSEGLERLWAGWLRLEVSADAGFAEGGLPAASILTIPASLWKLLVLAWLGAVGWTLTSRRQVFVDAMTRGGLWNTPVAVQPRDEAALTDGPVPTAADDGDDDAS